jgi:predicted DNA-binding transcriptional regulator AlpA
VQKTDIQLPADDPIDLWDLTRLIAKSICPSMREAEDYAWLQQKVVKLPTSELEIQSDMTAAERAELLRILPGLPPHAGLSAKNREVLMDAYLKHPDRPPWKPVFVSEEAIAANSLQILEIQEKHRLALQEEIAAGKIVAFDHHHVSANSAGKNIFIRREDALKYLKARKFRITEDSDAFSLSSKRLARAPVAERAISLTTPSANRQLEPREADSVKVLERTSASAPPLAPAERIGTLVPSLSPIVKPASHQDSKTRSSVRKGTEAQVEPERKTPTTVILRRSQVEARTSLSRSAIYDRLDPNSPRYDPTFPKQVKLGSTSVGWLESEIETWLTTRTRATRH